MVIQILETHLVIGFIGVIVGVFASRFYYRRTVRSSKLGQIIDYSLIQKQIQDIEKLSSDVRKAAIGLSESSDALLEQIKSTRDVESSVDQSLFSGGSLLDLESEEPPTEEDNT
jgi:hypothetical protein